MSTFIDFRNPSAIGRYSQEVDSTCRMLGGSSPNCITAREVLGVILQANTCFYNWSPVCQDRLKDRLDIATPCANGDYDTSPLFKAYLCPPVLDATTVIPPPPSPIIPEIQVTEPPSEGKINPANIILLVLLLVLVVLLIRKFT